MAVSDRIRWETEPEITSAAYSGYAGTFGVNLFRIYAPDESDDRWILVSLLPGAEHRIGYGGSAEELKPIAERLLSEFVSSLGAVWPPEPDGSAAFQCREARSVLARWDAGRNDPDGRIYDRERVLADQVKALLPIAETAPEAAREKD
jgi:hypothetical protein